MLTISNRKLDRLNSFCYIWDMSEVSSRNIKGIISSYPKSGSTWLKFMLAGVIAPGDHDFDSTTDLIPMLDTPEMESSSGSTGIFRSHKICLFPHPTIHLHRHVLDVLKSFYFHFVKFYNYSKDINEFFREMEYGKDWRSHVSLWLDSPYAFSYEKLLIDPLPILEQVCKTFGIPYSKEILLRSIEYANLENMKKIEKTKGIGKRYADTNSEIPFVGGSSSLIHNLKDSVIDKTIEVNTIVLSSLGYSLR